MPPMLQLTESQYLTEFNIYILLKYFKMKKLIFLIAILTSFVSYAQTTDDVTLIVMGSGTTKEDAVNNALRSAVEQAFGVFVSANTEIINDELVKDEIATVTSGNIKSYKELSLVNLSDGRFTVSLEAIVSTKTLAVYAKNHGSSAEFAGATFGANLKLAKLNKINTEKVFENLIKQCKEIIPHTFETELVVGNPTANGDLPMTIYLYSTPNAYQLSDLIVSSVSALSLNAQEIALMKEMEIEIYSTHIINTAFQENVKTVVWRTYDGWKEYPFRNRIEMSLYAPLPVDQIYDSLKSAIGNYCIKDNLNNTYNIDLNSIIVGKEKPSREYNYDEDDENGKYLGEGEMVFAMYSIYNAIIREGDSHMNLVKKTGSIIRMPYSYLRPTKVSKKKELTYPRKMIGKYNCTLNIPIETLNQITSFEVTILD